MYTLYACENVDNCERPLITYTNLCNFQIVERAIKLYIAGYASFCIMLVSLFIFLFSKYM